MTWLRLQSLTEALLAGDNVLPKSVESRLSLLEYALEEVSSVAETLVLYTDKTDTSREKIRRSVYDKNKYIAKANLPTTDEDEIDIDDGLCFAIARLMASFISRDKFQLHEKKAEMIIQRYNAKIYSYREDI
jgi:hypothetical protein